MRVCEFYFFVSWRRPVSGKPRVRRKEQPEIASEDSRASLLREQRWAGPPGQEAPVLSDANENEERIRCRISYVPSSLCPPPQSPLSPSEDSSSDFPTDPGVIFKKNRRRATVEGVTQRPNSATSPDSRTSVSGAIEDKRSPSPSFRPTADPGRKPTSPSAASERSERSRDFTTEPSENTLRRSRRPPRPSTAQPYLGTSPADSRPKPDCRPFSAEPSGIRVSATEGRPTTPDWHRRGTMRDAIGWPDLNWGRPESAGVGSH